MGFQHKGNYDKAWKALQASYRQRWLERYEEVKAYVEMHGLPGVGEPHSNWFLWQREKFRNNNLDQEKIELIEQLGYSLTKPNFSRRGLNNKKNLWKQRFEKLKTFVETHHRLPNKKDQPNYSWLMYQKESYREGRLDLEQIHLLRSIGLTLESKRRSFKQCISDYKNYYGRGL